MHRARRPYSAYFFSAVVLMLLSALLHRGITRALAALYVDMQASSP